jgi:hypothetical protein
MNWKDIIKYRRGTAGRNNPDDFKEYGQATPMDISEKEKGDRIKAPKKPLTEQEKLRRTQMRMATRKRNKEKEALEEKRKTLRPSDARDTDTIIAEEDEKERQRLKDGPKNTFP